MFLCLDSDDITMKDSKSYFTIFSDLEFKRIKMSESNELKLTFQ